MQCTYEDNIIETITFHFDLHQLTHLRKSFIMYRFDFLLLNHSSLHTNFPHQIVFAKCNLKVYYPPPSESEVWYYPEADLILIRPGSHKFSWKKTLSNLNIDGQVTVFNRTMLNILKNFVSHETIECYDKDPPWFNKRIKSLIQEVTVLLEAFQTNRNNLKMITCLNIPNYPLALLINTSKQSYYSKIVEKLENTQRSSKAY